MCSVKLMLTAGTALLKIRAVSIWKVWCSNHQSQKRRMSEKICHSTLNVKMLTSFSKKLRKRGEETITNSVITLLTMHVIY